MENIANIVNLTPHAIVLRSSESEDTIVPPSGTVARVSSVPGETRTVPGIPVPVAGPDIRGPIEGLPAPVEGVVYIVSAVVGDRVSRPDVLMPGTGPQDGPIRNEKGHIVAVTRLKSTKQRV